MDVMERIWDWVNDNDGRPMLLLTGAAGLGKSTIAQTLAKECAGDNKLAASFFFSRGTAQSTSISRVILTLVYQLAISIPSAQELIKETFKADPSIPEKNLAAQFTKLIYQPILAIKHLISPMIVIIDALDECEDKNGVVKLIEIITGVLQEERSFPLSFFFTSRLEDYITGRFSEPMTQLKASRLALEDFKRFDETEDDEIARLNPVELVKTWVRDNASARSRILQLIESGSNLSDKANTGQGTTGGLAKPIFIFPFTLSGGRGDDTRVTCCVEHPLEIDLQKPFTFLGWFYSSDTLDWRTLFSFESPLCRTSLLSIALMPHSSQIFFGYMRDAHRRIEASAGAYVPASAWFHFAFVLFDSTRVGLYINGVKEFHGRLDTVLFNAEPKSIVLGRTKYNGNASAQWNGKLRNAKVFDRALKDVEIAVESKWAD